MHSAEIRKEIVDRVVARGGKLHPFDALDAKKTAARRRARKASSPGCARRWRFIRS